MSSPALNIMRSLCLCIVLLAPRALQAQPGSDYAASIRQHRAQYKAEFLEDPRSPLTAADTAFLDFYPPDSAWRIPARLSLTPDAPAFDLPTYSGITRRYRQYGVLHFEAAGQARSLSIYQNLSLIGKDSSYRDYLFLPFKDKSNGSASYGGGRYLDFRSSEIREGLLLLDFNKCYNPWCAYSDGYNCPIPPPENHLLFAVTAGERMFLKPPKH